VSLRQAHFLGEKDFAEVTTAEIREVKADVTESRKDLCGDVCQVLSEFVQRFVMVNRSVRTDSEIFPERRIE
jgi:hypothetical protein